MPVEIERSVTVQRYFQKFSGLRVAREVDATVNARRFALRTAVPHLVCAKCRTQRITLAQPPALFDEHAHARTDPLGTRTFRGETLRFAQLHEPLAALARRHLGGKFGSRRSLLGAVLKEADA